MMKQRYSIRPGDVGKPGLQQRYMFRKGKTVVEGDPKKSWSGIEMEAGAEQEEVSLVGIQ